MKQVLVSETRCSGCLACEVACVAIHEGRFGIATARIRVQKLEPLGIDRPRLCRFCADAPCLAACPAGALSRRDDTAAIVLDVEACIVCPACADACPFGVVSLHPASGLPLICDLCDGDPACVKRCVTGALAYGDPDGEARAGCEAPPDPFEDRLPRSQAHRA